MTKGYQGPDKGDQSLRRRQGRWQKYEDKLNKSLTTGSQRDDFRTAGVPQWNNQIYMTIIMCMCNCFLII